VNETPTWLTNKDLAARYKVSEKTIQDWRHRGVGPRGVKIGRHVRYLDDAVREWESEKLAAAG
jgi:predicted DNA-binding transcriptional regulator AlpA